MSAGNTNRARRETVVLTRDAVAAILVSQMGWEPEDAAIFWRLARRETSSPGIMARLHARAVARAFMEENIPNRTSKPLSR